MPSSQRNGATVFQGVRRYDTAHTASKRRATRRQSCPAAWRQEHHSEARCGIGLLQGWGLGVLLGEVLSRRERSHWLGLGQGVELGPGLASPLLRDSLFFPLIQLCPSHYVAQEKGNPCLWASRQPRPSSPCSSE